MVRKALLIGINYIGTKSELSGCINDVNDMSKVLKSTGYNCNILHDNTDITPTKENILHAIEWLIDDAKSGDKLFFHYSGHGTQVFDENGDEKSGKDQCICALDGEIILDDELFAVMIKPLPEGCSLIALMDCCHSGTILDLQYTYSLNDKSDLLINGKPLESFKMNNNNNSPANVWVISGCMDSQYSTDAFFFGRPNGAMTYAFLRELSKKFPVFEHKKYLFKVLKSMRKYLTHNGYNQYPMLTCSIPLDTKNTTIEF